MLCKDTKMLELNQYKKSDKAAFINYADIECLINKIDATKVGKHILSRFSMSTIFSFKSIENKHGKCRGKDCMKRFCES